jgi:hypothetical protein
MAWLGDHSHSWLTADEILAAERPGAVRKDGVVTLDEYNAWDKVSQPKHWSGGIMGRDIEVSTPNEIGPARPTFRSVGFAKTTGSTTSSTR